jgi:hypothetical protein
MERQLNNPLRPSVKTLQNDNPELDRSKTTNGTQKSISAEKPPKNIPPIQVKTEQLASTDLEKQLLHPDVRKTLDHLNVPEELRKLMLQLTQNGLEIAGPKRTYIKHSYEIDQELHQRFHEMHPVLGFKKVKDAINDAISSWCDSHESEYRRRSGQQK